MKQEIKLTNTVILNLALILISIGLTACDKLGPAQEAGRQLDEAAEDASRMVKHELEKVKTKTQAEIKQVDTEVSDADITSKIKLALMMREGLNSLTVSVKTQAGVVTLSGSVGDAAQSKLAYDLARAVKEVKRVDNNLTIVSASK